MPLAPTGSDVVALTPLFASVDNGSLMVFVPFLITTRAENACSIYCQYYSRKYVDCTVLLEQEGKDDENGKRVAIWMGNGLGTILMRSSLSDVKWALAVNSTITEHAHKAESCQ